MTTKIGTLGLNFDSTGVLGAAVAFPSAAQEGITPASSGASNATKLQALLDRTGTAIFGNGEFSIASTITGAGRSIVIEGLGPQNTWLVWPSGVDAFDFDFTGIDQSEGPNTLTIRNLSIVTEGAWNANGLSATWPAPNFNNRFFKYGKLENVSFRGYDVLADGWLDMATIENYQQFTFECVEFLGRDGGRANDGTPAEITESTKSRYGVTLSGGALPTEAAFIDCTWFNMQQAVRSRGTLEGTRFIGGQMIRVNEGIDIQIGEYVAWLAAIVGTTNANGRPLLDVDGLHINAWKTAIATEGVIDINIRSEGIYRLEVSASTDPIIALANAQNVTINASVNTFSATDCAALDLSGDYFGAAGATGNVSNLKCDNLILTGDFSYGVRGGTVFSRLDFSGFRKGANGVTFSVADIDPAIEALVTPGSPGGYYYRDNNLTVGTGAGTLVGWAVEYEYVPLISSNTFVFPAGTGSRGFRVTGRLVYAANATGIRSLEVRKNGSTGYAGDPSITTDAVSSGTTTINICADVSMAVGEALSIVAFQNSGGNLDILANLSAFKIELI